MKPPQEVAPVTDEHPLLRLSLTASDCRLLAGLLVTQLETESRRSVYLETLAQRLSVRAVLIESRTPQA